MSDEHPQHDAPYPISPEHLLHDHARKLERHDERITKLEVGFAELVVIQKNQDRQHAELMRGVERLGDRFEHTQEVMAVSIQKIANETAGDMRDAAVERAGIPAKAMALIVTVTAAIAAIIGAAVGVVTAIT